MMDVLSVKIKTMQRIFLKLQTMFAIRKIKVFLAKVNNIMNKDKLKLCRN
jgi:hypothetical protein